MRWVFGEIVTKNECSVRRRIIVVQKPRVVFPQIRPLETNSFTKTTHNAQIIFLVDSLAEIIVSQTSTRLIFSKKLSVFRTNQDLTLFRPKWSFKMIFADPSDIPTMSVRSLTVNRRFLCTNSLIWLTYCSSVDVDGRPGLSKSSTRSLPSLKSLYHL